MLVLNAWSSWLWKRSVWRATWVKPIGTNSLDDLLLEDLMKVLEAITLEHVEPSLH